MTTVVRRAVLLALTALGLLGAAVLFAAPASAHASVVDSTPADGARLKSAPHVVTVVFDENVGISSGVGYLQVTDGSGKPVDAGAAFHPGGDGVKVSDTLRSGLGNGSYTASFRVVSADSHPVAGTIRFVVGNGALVRGTTAAGVNDDPVTSAALDVSRWVSYGGIALLGGAWLVLAVWPAGRDERRARRLIWAGWGAATLGAVLELFVQGPYSSGAGLSELTDLTLLNATLHINYGVLHCLRLVLLGLLAPLLAAALQPGARTPRRDVLAGVLGVGALATYSGAGHAATTQPAWISLAVDVVHLAAMAVWLGGLLMLVGALLPRRDPDELSTVLPVFSRAAFVSIMVLAGSGTYAAWRGIGTVHAVFTTSYGLLVMAKVMLFVAILAVANLPRKLVRRRTVAYAMTAAALDEAAKPTTNSISTSPPSGCVAPSTSRW